MYYIEKNNKIVLYNDSYNILKNTLQFVPEYRELEIKKTQEGYTIADFEIMTIEEAQQKNEQKKREQINRLFLTAADVERAIYKLKGLDFDDILKLVDNDSQIDLKELKIELKANNFYRGNPYVDKIGKLLGISSFQLDEFFKTGNWEKLK